MATARIVLNVVGGVVRAAFSSDPDVEVAIANWDTDDVDPSTETVEVLCSDGKQRRAIVTCATPYGFQDSAGTDVAVALHEAGVGMDLTPPAEQDDGAIFALYDFDLGTLASTRVFCSYSEAADEIDPRQTDVIVVRIGPV